jgi:membrane-bound ClpP family serine protease
VKRSLFIITCLFLSVAALAGKPKFGPGIFPGVTDGDGNTTGDNSCGTEVTLPVGLPVAGDEAAASASESNAASNIVYTFDLSPEDGASSINQTHSAFEKAKNMNAACVLIRIDGFAGGWDVAENIRQEIIRYDRPVMVYVNNQTVPAANFISMGADSIYTKKGSTISNKKAVAKKNAAANHTVSKQEEVVALNATSSSTPTDPDALYANDATMNEILFKAGLSNLTVVEHEANFSERAIDFLMNPFMVMAVLLLIGFVMRKTAKGKLPGPLLYLLALSVLLYLAPFQLSGLANSGEIIASLALIVAVIASARYDKRWLTGIFLIGLTFLFSLVRAGDTEAIMRYGTFSELLTLPSIPLGLVILGWWIGKIGESKIVKEVKTSETAQATFATAA